MTIGVVYGRIENGALGDSDVASSFGLPGSNLTAAYMRCEFNVKITVEDDLSTYCAISGGRIIQDGITGTVFESYLWCFGESWSVTIVNENVDEWMKKTQCFAKFTQTKTDPVKARLEYAFGVDSGRGTYIGNLSNFEWISETEGVGYVWVGGSAIYNEASITNPILITGHRIAVPGLRELLNYYPWGIKKGASYASCNRAGGSLKIKKGTSWRDCKNTQSVDKTKSTVFARKSSVWDVCPKL